MLHKLYSLALFSVIIVLAWLLYYSYVKQGNTPKFDKPADQKVIVTGEGNPGRVTIYQKSTDGNFSKKSIDTGFRFVWTVRIGDVRNDGKNRIYAGVGNSFFSDPHGCEVLELDPADNFKTSVIDNVGDLRCKDLTIGDLKNDGKNELIVGTQGSGIIRMYTYDQANKKWLKENIAQNDLPKNDKDNKQLLPYEVLQSAVHIIKVKDADNDGKNDLLALVSDAKENPTNNPKLSVLMFKPQGKTWNMVAIDRLDGSLKGTVDAADIYKTGKNTVLVSAAPYLLAYTFKNGTWEKTVIDDKFSDNEKNVKGLAIDTKTDSLFTATGITHAGVYKYDLADGQFKKKEILDISKHLDKYRLLPDISDDSLALNIADLNNDGKNELIVVGEQDSGSSEKPSDQKFGWEWTSIGFTAVLWPKDDGTYTPEFLDFHSALAVDSGKLD